MAAFVHSLYRRAFTGRALSGRDIRGEGSPTQGGKPGAVTVPSSGATPTYYILGF